MTPSLRGLSRLAVPAAVLALSGCTCSKTDGALQVNAHFTSLLPGCVRLTAEDADGHSTSIESVRAHLDPANTRFGVERGTAWSDTLTVTFESFESTCSGVPLDSQHTSFRVAPNRLETWDVTVKILDGDHDGFAATSAGGTDCNDAAATIHPGAAESCAGGTDFDCDGKVGCADSDCTGKSCSDGDACTTTDVCLADGGCVGDAVVCNAPPTNCYAATGACDGDGGCDYTFTLGANCALGDGGTGACRGDGSCGAGEADCTNGQDDDNDGEIDCEDSDCLAQACDDHQACTLNDTCTSVSDAGCVGTVNPCNTPPTGSCWLATGTCTTATGVCVYSGATARGCDDGNPCTVGDTCEVDGGCKAGLPPNCTTPPNTACWNGTGTCAASDGGCSYTAKSSGTTCDDGNPCTAGDRCTAGTCGGAGYACTPNECQTGGACQGDGGCTFTARTGACDGGSCIAGACVGPLGFPFQPGNFIPAQHTPSGALTIGCAVTISTSGSGSITGAGCTPAPAANFQLSDAGGLDVMVMAVQTLTVTDAGSITVSGSRPLVIAVYGDADFNGPVFANSQRTGGNGPGNRPSGSCGTQDGANGTQQSGGGGGAAYERDGGNGGNGDGTTSGTGGLGGVAIAGGDIPLLGGCPGGAGRNDGSNGGASSTGGAGGGAIQLTAAGTLRVNGIVSASGAGGARGVDNNACGGGGGGSGGVVVLEAAIIDVTLRGRLTCNGGAGGGGTNGNASNASSGGDGSTSTATAATPGGGEGGGGGGGAGGYGTTPPGDGVAAASGKAGGGGGASTGRIYVKQHGPSSACVNASAIVSPPAVRLNCP